MDVTLVPKDCRIPAATETPQHRQHAVTGAMASSAVTLDALMCFN